jgi:hypothetical protein
MSTMKLIKLISTVFIGLGITLVVGNTALAGSIKERTLDEINTALADSSKEINEKTERANAGVASVYSDGNLTVVISPIETSGGSSNRKQSQYYSYSGSLGNNGIDIKRGAKNSGSNSRQVYTWDNKGTKYQVIWKPSDPEYIRVRVISDGKEILNRVISRTGV